MVDFQERYESGDTPWDLDRADQNLIKMVQATPIAPCSTLDIGCGTGSNAIWLNQQGFEVTAVDSSQLAISKAREKASKSQADISFYELDVLRAEIPGAPFDFIFDRGCFHHFLEQNELGKFAARVATLLEDGALWLSLAGSSDEMREGPGPPQLSARHIVSAAEPYFEIISLVAGHFDSGQEVPAKNWLCLMKKR